MKKIVTFGEIMLRLSTPDFQRFTQAHVLEATYGGGEANVAVSLANYGEQVEFVTRLPKNDLGDACMATLRSSRCWDKLHPSRRGAHGNLFSGKRRRPTRQQSHL